MQNKLKELYMQSSKHSNYQILPSALKPLIDDSDMEVRSRYEKERLEYICANVELRDKTVLDIGGNIGFFTFEAITQGAGSADYYEGNTVHAEFAETAAGLLGLSDRITVHPEYYLFNDISAKYDVVFLLNVVHHFGDDFGQAGSIENAKQEMLRCINHMSYVSDMMVFQMGFNHCGDRYRCLWEKGTKSEMEEYLEKGTAEHWDIIKTGIAIKKENGIVYEDMNEENNVRIDSLGEFLNRPIFIMKSKH